MHKYIFSYDDSLQLDDTRIKAIEQKFADALDDPDLEIFSLPPGVTLQVLDVATRKPKAKK